MKVSARDTIALEVIRMSSIAYITDQEMIEFHRLNGHTSMVFWRPTSQKKFRGFFYDDYLFFLSKGTQKDKEKGIIGYGRYTKTYMMSFEEMWKRFGIQTGYRNRELLHEAILKVAKRDVLPTKLHCLQLEDVVFFQVPIYLSELQIKISKQIESYIYIDQENPMISYEIIKKAATFGKDMWTSLVNEQHSSFAYQGVISLLQNLYTKLVGLPYNEYEKKKIMSLTKTSMIDTSYRYLACSKDDFVHYENNQLTLYIPCLISGKNGSRNIQFCIGRYHIYHAFLLKAKANCKIVILLDKESKQWQEYLCSLNINYMVSESTRAL